MNRSKKILAVLLVILAVSLTYRIMNPYRQQRVTELTYSNTMVRKTIRGSGSPSDESSDGPSVYLNLISQPHAVVSEVKKELFSAPQRIHEKKAEEDRAEQVPGAPQPSAAVLSPEDRVRNDLARFKVMGLFEDKGEKAVFLQRGKDILVVREKDRIDGKYRIEEIEGQTIRLTALEIGETVYIDMSDF